jgi:hypothetical protein
VRQSSAAAIRHTSDRRQVHRQQAGLELGSCIVHVYGRWCQVSGLNASPPGGRSSQELLWQEGKGTFWKKRGWRRHPVGGHSANEAAGGTRQRPGKEISTNRQGEEKRIRKRSSREPPHTAARLAAPASGCRPRSASVGAPSSDAPGRRRGPQRPVGRWQQRRPSWLLVVTGAGCTLVFLRDEVGGCVGGGAQRLRGLYPSGFGACHTNSTVVAHTPCPPPCPSLPVCTTALPAPQQGHNACWEAADTDQAAAASTCRLVGRQ